MNNPVKVKLNPRKTFWKCGACSRAMFHLLNHEFENIKPEEEKAADLLAGGIAMKGYQCGMLWGAALAIGVESFRRYNNSNETTAAVEAPNEDSIRIGSNKSDINEATAVAIISSRHLVASFRHSAGTVNCRDITKVDWEKKSHFIIFLLKTIAQGFVFSPCFKFIEKWTPEAIQTANTGLSERIEQKEFSLCSSGASEEWRSDNQPCLSCATEVLKKMGASNEASVTVAGLAGGIGLSGNGCGALSAVIWYKMLEWGKINPGKTPEMFNNPTVKSILKSFNAQTGSEMLCSKICGRTFATMKEHTEYLQTGGCRKLLEELAKEEC